MSVERALHHALETGDLAPLARLYVADALLDANLPGARTMARGRDAVAARFAEWWRGAGRVVDWRPAAYPDGVAIWLERVAADGAAIRQRHYLRVRRGHVTHHWIYAAPPRTSGPPANDDREPPAGVERLGKVTARERLASSGWSGNRIERVTLADGRRLIAKRVVPAADWIARATGDRGREGLLVTSGVMERMPAAIDHTVVAAQRDGDAWWVVMHDVSGQLLDGEHVLTRDEHRRILAALNLMWEEFWGERLDMLAPLPLRLGWAGRAVAEREREGLDLLPKQFEVFWEAFADAVDREVADAVLALVEEPAPLARALEARGTTLLHGDVRDEQIGWAEDRLILLDWGLATQGHPVVDFAWHVMHNGWRVQANHDELVEDFRRARGEHDDPYALELGIVAGLVMYGWVLGHSATIHPDPSERAWARAELDWWVPRARRALETLPPS